MLYTYLPSKLYISISPCTASQSSLLAGLNTSEHRLFVVRFFASTNRNWTGFLNLAYARPCALQSLGLHPAFVQEGRLPLPALWVVHPHSLASDGSVLSGSFIARLTPWHYWLAIQSHTFIWVRVPRCITWLPPFILWRVLF